MTTSARPTPHIDLLVSNRWADYELLDSGAGAKLERFGPYRFMRPESGARSGRARCRSGNGRPPMRSSPPQMRRAQGVGSSSGRWMRALGDALR